MPKEFINFILIDVNKKVLVNNLKENISEEFLLNIQVDKNKKIKISMSCTLLSIYYEITFLHV